MSGNHRVYIAPPTILYFDEEWQTPQKLNIKLHIMRSLFFRNSMELNPFSIPKYTVGIIISIFLANEGMKFICFILQTYQYNSHYFPIAGIVAPPNYMH
jgi:hypothetical protein